MATLHVEAVFNPEEAAHAAAEFVSSLDNLPGEVAFLLEEIRDRDDRINELLDRIDTRHLSLTQKARSAMAKAEAAAASSPSSSASHPYPLPLSAGSPIPTSHLSSREELALKKVMGEFEKVQALQDEKVELAERMERIVLRAKERGRAEWIRVGGKDIAEVESEEMAAMSVTGGRASKGGTPGLGAGEGVLGVPSAGLGGERPQKRKKPNLSLAASMPPPPAPVRHPPLGTSNSFLASAHNTPLSSSHGAGGSSGRKRDRGDRAERERESRSVAASASEADADGEMEDYLNFQHAGSNVGSGASFAGTAAEGAYGITGPMPAFGFAGSGPGSGYAEHGGHATRGPKGYTVTHPPPEDVDMDAEGEMDGDVEADDKPYCICQQRSYGEMVGCDNEECPYEWFHTKCLNMTGVPSGVWFCPDCTKLLGMNSRSGRAAEKAEKQKKGRKSRG